jgi:hypothetical protein
MGKREGLVYLVVALWVIMGVFASAKNADLKEVAAYFGSLITYVATYVWSETKKPSVKTGIFRPGPTSRREAMIYIVTCLWAIAGGFAIWFDKSLMDLTVYFVSLTGFVTSWILGEYFKPEDNIIEDIKNISGK